MKIKRVLFGLLALSLLACNFVSQIVFPPTSTPIPTATPTATQTPTATASPISTATQVPLIPAFIPPKCANVALATLPADASAHATPEVQVTEISQGEQLTILRTLSDI